MAKRSFNQCFFHFEADASEMDKIDSTIRLAGLKFPMGKRVIGRKHADLIVALGAFDISHNCTGTQLLVVARLCLLYEAILETYKKYPHLDIKSDFFYEEALADISENHPSLSKYLSASTLRQAIEIYLLAFHRSGLKPIKPNTNKTDAVETFIGQDVMEPSAAATHKRARIELEKLVKGWMAVRAIARRKQAKANKPKTAAVPYPEQQHGESDKAYILRLQRECEYYVEENEMYEKEGSREMKKHDDLYDDYNVLFNQNNELLNRNNELLTANNEWNNEKSEMQAEHIASVGRLHGTLHRMQDTIYGLQNTIRGMQDTIDRKEDENALLQDTIDRLNDQIDELKQRLGVDGDSWMHAYGRPEQRGRFPGSPGSPGSPGGRGGFTGFHRF